MSRYSAKIFLSCIRFQYAYCIFISRQNKLICVQRASKKDHKVCPTSSPPSGNTPALQLEYRCRAEDLAFFPPCRFSPQHLFIFAVRMVHTTGETREYYPGSTYYRCLIYLMSCDDFSLLRWVSIVSKMFTSSRRCLYHFHSANAIQKLAWTKVTQVERHTNQFEQTQKLFKCEEEENYLHDFSSPRPSIGILRINS